jgi:hypothetical protein
MSKTSSKKEQACESLKDKIIKGKNISRNSKVMIIAKYDSSVDGWVSNSKKPYTYMLKDIEKAIPQFIFILQKLYQGNQENLIHFDLHTGNIFMRSLKVGIELGLADFGRCVFRRHGEDPSMTFYGEYLIEHVSTNEFFSGYAQVPFEARLLNYCYRKNMDNVSPSLLVKQWENDPTLKMDSAGSTDTVTVNRSSIVSYLLKHVLFISMVENIQSISRKLRNNINDHLALYKSLSVNEKIVVDFILSRYNILSPFNAICEALMGKYKQPLFDIKGRASNTIVEYIVLSILSPYLQDGSSLAKALSTTQGADMRILWSDITRGR